MRKIDFGHQFELVEHLAKLLHEQYWQTRSAIFTWDDLDSIQQQNWKIQASVMLAKLLPTMSKQPGLFEMIREDERLRSSDRIIGELVCCDIFERLTQIAEADGGFQDRSPKVVAAMNGLDWHGMCYFGGWAASIAREGKPESPVPYGDPRDWESDDHVSCPDPRGPGLRRGTQAQG
jgi:hypothetical protein